MVDDDLERFMKRYREAQARVEANPEYAKELLAECAEDTQATDAELEESYRIALGWAKMSGQGG